VCAVAHLAADCGHHRTVLRAVASLQSSVFSQDCNRPLYRYFVSAFSYD